MMETEKWVSKCRSLVIDGAALRGRLRKTWNEVVQNDLQTLHLEKAPPQYRVGWGDAIKKKPSYPFNNTVGNKFNVKVGVHQGSVIKPLLFIMVLEALAHASMERTLNEEEKKDKDAKNRKLEVKETNCYVSKEINQS